MPEGKDDEKMLCPMPGKCRYDDFERTGVHFCVRPVCAHPRQQRSAIAVNIAALMKREEQTEADREAIQRLKQQYAETLR